MAKRLIGAALLALVLGAAAGCSERSAGRAPAKDTSFGISSADWPDALDDIASIRNALPSMVGDAALLDPRTDDEIVAEGFDILRARYSGPQDQAGLSVMNAREPGMAPRLALVTMFTGYSDLSSKPRCVDGSYVGSLPPRDDGAGVYPGFTEDDVPDDQLPWFACEIEPDADTQTSRRFAAGWFRGEIVCIVYGSSSSVIAALVRDLSEAWDLSEQG